MSVFREGWIIFHTSADGVGLSLLVWSTVGKKTLKYSTCNDLFEFEIVLEFLKKWQSCKEKLTGYGYLHLISSQKSVYQCETLCFCLRHQIGTYFSLQADDWNIIIIYKSLWGFLYLPFFSLSVSSSYWPSLCYFLSWPSTPPWPTPSNGSFYSVH